jgi:hypothetical protein
MSVSPEILQQRREERALQREQRLAALEPLRYSIPESAKILRKCVPGVYLAARQGRLKISKDGRRSYITRTELERYVAACDQTEAQAA